MAGGVLVCGNIVMDVVARPVDQLVWSATTWIDSLEHHMGGNGANTSYALAKLGVPVRLLSATGTDAFGDQLLERLGGAGVDVARIERMPGPSAASVALVNSAGERLLLHRAGVSTSAFAALLDFSGALSTGMSHFHLANIFALPLLRQHAGPTVHRARAAGFTTSLDTGWDSRGRWIEDLGPCLPYTDILFVNEDEALRLASADEPAGAAARLRALGATAVVVKLGARGCEIYSARGVAHIPAFDVPAVDTTGAGDCFAGAFLAARHRGLSLEEAGEVANAVSALAIQKLGSTDGLRSWDETQAWMRTASRRVA
ncbi:MAG TPA: carbohydrate kinase family protein [Bryobacteraceae bacterium]|nr:carbohydrate kinase family protein [Bryobacteraceae bacterium]